MHSLKAKLTEYFTVTLWQMPSDQNHRIHGAFQRLVQLISVMSRELAKGELNLRAMSLVFTTLLSLVPLIAVAFSVLKAFGVHNQIEPALLGLLEPMGPRGAEMTHNIIGFVENVKVGVLGALGLALLFYTIISLVQKIESAFNFVWRVKRPRSLARRFTDYFSVMLIGPVLVFSALGVTASLMSHSLMQQLQAIEPFGTLIVISSKLLPYLMIILAFTFLYTFIPNTRVRVWPAMIGGAVAGALWLSLGSLFAGFVASSSNYTAIYSSFAILFFFMIWLYLAWLILLIGSQVAFYVQHPKLLQVGGRVDHLSPRQREQEGLWLMTLLARRFLQGEPAMTLAELEEATALSNHTLQELITLLESAGLLAEVATQPSRYVPAQDLANISVHEILHVMQTAEEAQERGFVLQIDPALADLFQQRDAAQQAVLAQMSLRDLAQEQPA